MLTILSLLSIYLLPLALLVGARLVYRLVAVALRIPGLDALGFVESRAYFGSHWLKRAGARAAAFSYGYILAASTFFVAFMGGGTQTLSLTVDVLPNSAAESSGVQSGDRVVRIQDRELRYWEDLRATVAAHPNESQRWEVERHGKMVVLNVTPDGNGRVGVRARMTEVRLSVWEAVRRSAGQPPSVAWDVYASMVSMLWKSVSPTLSGPIDIVDATSQSRNIWQFVGVWGAFASYLWPLFALIDLAVGVLVAFIQKRRLPAVDTSQP